MIGVLTNEERHAQMAEAVKLFPMLRKKQKFGNKRISIICYGPSLKDTWHQIPLTQPMITVSGAHDFLLDHGITPQFHVECDPRKHKAFMLEAPTKTTTYLMASVCNPEWWPKLAGAKVKLWHLLQGPETVAWVEEHHRAGRNSLIGGGSTVGQRAMNVGGALGYRKFDVFGMDCSYTTTRHAGVHTGPSQTDVFVKAGGRKFRSTKQMIDSAIQMEDFLQEIDVEVKFYGDGLMQEMARIIEARKKI